MSETANTESTKPVQDTLKGDMASNINTATGNSSSAAASSSAKPSNSYFDDDSDEDLPIAKLMAKVQESAQNAKQSDKSSPKTATGSLKDSSRSSKEATANEKASKRDSKDRSEPKDKDRSKGEKKEKKEKKERRDREKEKEREREKEREKKERRTKERVRSREEESNSRSSKRRVESRTESTKSAPRTTARKTERRTLEIKMTKRGARDIDPDRPLKDQAIEAILVRWQYAMQWQPETEPIDINSGWMELPGMPGVAVGVHEETLGEIRDMRPKEPRPSYNYLSTLPSKTLRDMWRTALQKQMEALIEAEGENADLLPALKDELRTVDKFDYERSDRQWARKQGASAPAAVPTKASDAAAKQPVDTVKKEKSTKSETKDEKKSDESVSVSSTIVPETATVSRTRVGVIDDDDD